MIEREYHQDNLHLYNMDCMELMKKYPDKYFDLTIVDPPYFNAPQKLGYYGKRLSPIGVLREGYKKVGTWEVPNKEYFEELKRVSKNWIIWGANYYDFIEIFKTPKGEAIQDFLLKCPKNWIVWDKCNQQNDFNDYELAFTSFEKSTEILKYMWSGMMQGKDCINGHIQQGNKKLNEKRIHPTQKPVNLYKKIYLEYLSFSDQKLKI